MSDAAEFDSSRAHRYFSADCFNRAWEFIDKGQRTPADDLRMVHLVHASLWHWMERPDCTDRNLSIGYWQATRVYSLLGEAENARKYARLCLNHTPADDIFCLGYAHEALARAEAVGGDAAQARQHLDEATRYANALADGDDKQALLSDLKDLQ